MTDNFTAALYPVPGRSPEFNRRVAVHETGHAFVGRCVGTQLRSASIIPQFGSEGRVLSIAYEQKFYERFEDAAIEIVSLCERVERLMPELGVNRNASAEFFQRATTLAIELVAGSVCEKIFYPDLEILPTEHDEIEAQAFAKIAVASPHAVAAFLEYARAEAEGLIRDHYSVALAIVDELERRGELTGNEIDRVIARAVAVKSIANERQRQASWQGVLENAARLKTFA
jgi:ATP-dependent Zn protease